MTTTSESTAQIIRPGTNVVLRVADHYGVEGKVYDRGPILNSGQAWTVTITGTYGESLYVEDVPEHMMEVVPEPDTRDQQIVDLKAERESLERRVRIAEQQVQAEQQAMVEFKREVEVVASKMGKEHNMCNVLNNALEELGLTRIADEYRITVRVSTDISVLVNNADDEETARDWAESHLQAEWTSEDSDVEITGHEEHSTSIRHCEAVYGND